VLPISRSKLVRQQAGYRKPKVKLHVSPCQPWWDVHCQYSGLRWLTLFTWLPKMSWTFSLLHLCVKTIRDGGNDFKNQIIVMAPQWISKTAHGRALEEGFDPLKWFECAMTTLWKTHWRHRSIIYNLHNSKHHELEEYCYCRNSMEYVKALRRWRPVSISIRRHGG